MDWVARAICLGLGLGLGLVAVSGAWGQDELLEWSALPAMPEAVSGHFFGVVDSTLIVAGGSSFPVSPFQGGEKQWHDRTYFLELGSEAWVEGPRLPHAAAYGGVVSMPDGGLLLMGGSDGARHYSDVWSASMENGELVVEAALAPLPEAVAFGSAAFLEGAVYFVGGQSAPESTEALHNFWRYEIGGETGTGETGAWEELEAWPGPSRILPVVVAQGDAIYLFSGAELVARDDGSVGRNYLSGGYRYAPGEGWREVAGPPWPVVAAPAVAVGQSHVFVFGGDDGANADRTQALGDDHPGFRREVLAYHGITDTWVVRGEMAAAYVTTGAVFRDGAVLIAGGEDRPGHRSAEVLVATIQSVSGGFGAVNFAVVGVYFGLLIAMGIYFSRREQTTQDFFLGGQRVPWWAMGISIFGTQLSAITFLSIPARAYATDWVYVWANAGILLIAPYVVIWVLPRYRSGNFTTAYEYLESRFNVGVRMYGAFVFLLFQAGRMGIVLFLPSLALHAATGLDVYVCIITMGVLATAYTVLGGIEAVIWTDVAQVIVLVAGVLVALVIIVLRLDGGIGEVFSVASAADKFHMNNWTWDMTTTALWLCVVGNVFAVAYPYTADQTLVQRYLASASEADAKRAVWVNAILAVPATLVFFLVGTALWVFYRAHPETIDPTLQNDGVFPLFIVQNLPVGLSGLVIAAIFAAAMSSVDSSLNSISTVCVTDFYQRFFPPKDDAHNLRLARVLTCVFGVLGTGGAVLIAGMDVKSIFDQYMRLLGMTGGGLAGILALGIFSKRADGTGAIIGALCSAGIVFFVTNYTELHGFSYGMIGFVSAFCIGYVASWIAPGRVEGA